MDLRARVQRLSQAQTPTVVPPPSNPGTARLVSLEHDRATHRWLRGLMAFLAFFCYMLSIFQVRGRAGHTVLHLLILCLSLVGEVCIVLVYRIKARFAGLTNPATRAVHPLHSPHVSLMLCEMLLWILMAPPGMAATATGARVLDSLIILRSYVYVLYFTQLSMQSLFKRALASLCGYRFTSLYLFRYTFVSRNAAATGVGFAGAWLGLALLYSKGENVHYADAAYFCFSTMAFVGYGDVSPTGWVGRFTALLAWCQGLLMMWWCVSVLHSLLRVSVAERNLHTLFRANRLCAIVPGEAARTIQRTWKFYVAKRDGRNSLSIQFNALLLSNQVCSFRALHRKFLAAEVAFLRTTDTFEDTLTALSRRSSQSTTPCSSPRSARSASLSGGSGSPKSRRPFPLFRDVKSKASSTKTLTVSSVENFLPAATSLPTSPPAPLRLSRSANERRLKGNHNGSHSHVGDANVALASASELTARLDRLDASLNVLIRKAERMAPRRGALATEVAS